MAGKLVPALEEGLQFLPMWTSPQGYFSVLTTWYLSLLRVNDPRESKGEDTMPFMTYPWESHTMTSTIACWSHRSALFNTRRVWILEMRVNLGAFLEAGYHTLNTMMNENRCVGCQEAVSAELCSFVRDDVKRTRLRDTVVPSNLNILRFCVPRPYHIINPPSQSQQLKSLLFWHGKFGVSNCASP